MRDIRRYTALLAVAFLIGLGAYAIAPVSVQAGTDPNPCNCAISLDGGFEQGSCDPGFCEWTSNTWEGIYPRCTAICATSTFCDLCQ